MLILKTYVIPDRCVIWGLYNMAKTCGEMEFELWFGKSKKACNHEWIGNIPVRNNSQDGDSGQHCKHCYKEKSK